MSNPENVMGIETGVGFFLLIVALIYLTFATQESSSKVVKVIQTIFSIIIFFVEIYLLIKLGAHNNLSSGFLET